MNKMIDFVDKVTDFKKANAWIFWGVVFGLSIIADMHFYYQVF